MKFLATSTALAALLLIGCAVATAPANAFGWSNSQAGLGWLEAPSGGEWLIHHYDNRGGQVTDGPDFDDSGEVIFEGYVGDIGHVTVEQSAAWTWNTYAAAGGTGAAAPCALAYATPRTLVRIHTHQGISTEDVTAPLTLIPAGEFPFSAAGLGDDTGLDVGTHTFTGTVTITDAYGNTIAGVVEGGTNCEVEVFPGNHTSGVFDFDHSDTNNTVQTALEITGGTGRFTGVTGTGTLAYTYDTLEPHNLLSANIAINSKLPRIRWFFRFFR